MTCNIVASGSKGNAVILNDLILIDCGVPYYKIGEIKRNIKLVLLTHEHSDHFRTKTIQQFARSRPTLRFGCCEWLVPKLLKAGVSEKNIDVYQLNTVYAYGNSIRVWPFALFHDVENCGYHIAIEGEIALYATDTAFLGDLSAPNYDLYMIEANYEEVELQKRIARKLAAGEFCYEQNVAGRHLSKEQADAFITRNAGEKSKFVYLHQHKES